MTVYGEVTYVFYLPQDYDEMKQFEAENDLSIYRRTEDTIAVRYNHKVNATYPYKSKADRKTEPQRDDKKCTYAYDKYSEEWYPIYAKRKDDEPQTDCEGCDRYEDGGELCDMCALEKGKEDAQTERSE